MSPNTTPITTMLPATSRIGSSAAHTHGNPMTIQDAGIRSAAHVAANDPSSPPTAATVSTVPTTAADVPDSWPMTTSSVGIPFPTRFVAATMRALPRRNGWRNSQRSPSRTPEISDSAFVSGTGADRNRVLIIDTVT